MTKADEIVEQLQVFRMKARKDVAKNENADPEKYSKLVGIVSGLNIAIIAAKQIANRKK